MKVKVGISARHVHLTKEDVEFLFGEGYELVKKNNLSQTGEYACEETLTLKTEKDFFNSVRVLGPVRHYTQIEISKTDAYKLGINPPVRDSGDIEGSAPITLIGPKGELKKEYGCIIANRHIHANPMEAMQYGLSDDQIVKVAVDGEKGGILNNVHIKIADTYNLELHLDLDDGNSHLLKTGDEGDVIINE